MKAAGHDATAVSNGEERLRDALKTVASPAVGAGFGKQATRKKGKIGMVAVGMKAALNGPGEKKLAAD
jgi:hypothetical protein